MWALDGGESVSFRMLSLLEVCSLFFSFSLILTLDSILERLRSAKHVGTLSILGRGEIGREPASSPDFHWDRLFSNSCLTFFTFCVLLQSKYTHLNKLNARRVITMQVRSLSS